jgi:hypothetical protein
MTDVLGMIPDMLIIDEKEKIVLAHVELKYNPMGYVLFEKDLDILSGMYKGKGNISLALDTDPHKGNWQQEEHSLYSLSKEFLPVYLVIGHHESKILTATLKCWSTLKCKSKLLFARGPVPIQKESSEWNVEFVPKE